MKSKAYPIISAFWIKLIFCPRILLSLFVLTGELGYSQSEYRFWHYDSKDGLESNDAGSLVQDSLGYIWIQSAGGLSRFDGYDFKVYKNDSDNPERSLDRVELYLLKTDPTRNLWATPIVQTPYYVLTKYDRKTDGFIKYSLDLKGSSWVRDVCFERHGTTMWFPCRLGLYSFHPETNEVKMHLNIQGDSLSSLLYNDIQGIVDHDSVLLIASKGLWIFNKAKETFRRPNVNPKDSALLNNILVFVEGFDFEDNDVWFLFDAGLAKVDENFSIVYRFDFPPEMSGKHAINFNWAARDKAGAFWIATDGNGLCRYDPRDSSFISIKNNPLDPYTLKSNYVHQVMVDREQNIWVSTNQGISCLRRQSLEIHNSPIAAGSLHASMLYKAGDKDYVIMAKAKRDGTNEIAMAPLFRDDLDNLDFHTVASIESDFVEGIFPGKNNIWLLLGAGVVGVPINKDTRMIEPGPLQKFSADRYNPLTYSLFNPVSALEDPEENLWVGGQYGLTKIIAHIPFETKGSLTRYEHVDLDSSSISHDDVHGLYAANKKSVWVNTGTGIDLYSDNRFYHVFKNKERPTAIHVSNDSMLYVGTSGGLYAGIKSESQYRFHKISPLKNMHIVRIAEDRKGRLWISTLLGIVCYDPLEQVAIEFNRLDGLLHYRISHQPANSISDNGIMVVSDRDGFSLFDPMSLRIDKEKTQPVLTRLTVNNEVPYIGTKAKAKNRFAIEKDISVLRNLVLDYWHNNFAIEFSGMEMTAPEKNLYRHMLQGYDPDWIETDWKDRTAAYTNLDAGEYIFKVKASNHHGIWSDQETSLVILILPPPWKTWWAYTLYAIALIGIFLFWRNYEIKRLKLKHRAEHLSELDTLKTRFFANISHEFRTPITLILGPLKDLYGKTKNDEQKSLYATMIRNGQRLLHLINQLLDLSKLEAGKMTLQVSRTDLVQFLKDIASSYESLAADKSIRFSFHADVAELRSYLDDDKVEKVIHNILSNAFKFTNENGEVDLYLKEENKHAVISIRDTGIGIPDHQIDKIFDRFYQVDSSQTRSYEGSGIGMALAKELVELHHGSISIESKEGKGSTFTVRLPLNQKHLDKDIDYSRDLHRKKLISDEFIAEVQPTDANIEVISESLPVLLIVEDNTDMRNYIRKTLKESYNIEESVNGKEGVKKAKELVPDLIISDVMMPEMDGYQLCELIKTDEVTSHIPVILLTAKADHQSKLRGLEQRADDYLLKPFDGDELKLIVRNRIEERQKMRERFSREIVLEPAQIAISSLDEKFLKKVLELIEAHMEDENFSIEDFSREAGYSRMQFYRKIKALAAQTPSQFVRTIRLKRAAQMLIKKSDNVAQIAYSVGFGNLAYFNKCFKDQFGVTPGQFSNETVRTNSDSSV